MMPSPWEVSDSEGEEVPRVSEEGFAKRLWKTILKKKGLPSNTPYVFIPDDDYLYKPINKLEDKCDELMRRIRAKKQQSAKSTPVTSSSPPPPPTTTTTPTSSECSPDEDEEIERKRKKKRGKNSKKRQNKKLKKQAATPHQD